MKQPFELDVNVNEIDSRILQVCAKAEEEYINATRKNKIGVNSMNDVVNVGSVNSVNIVNANTPFSPAIIHPILASIARTITIGTKYDAIISAIFAIGAFDP